MGYTHYWTPKVATDKEWNELVKVTKTLHKNLPNNIKICGGMGDGKPEFSKTMIDINGDDTQGLDHETFRLKPNRDDWNFCKTACKPYDLLVCAILLAAEEILGYEVSSDGQLDDWKPAINFYMQTVHPDQKKMEVPSFLVERE